MKHPLKLLSLIGLTTISCLVWYGVQLVPKASLPKPTFISSDSTPEKKPSQDTSTPANSPSAAPASAVKQSLSPSLASSQITAPKQLAIKQTVKKEYTYHALVTSNDPLTQGSWALSALNAQTAWDTTTGSGVTVAVIDTGFALSHQDLASQWYTNAGETGATLLGDPCWTGVAANKSSNNCDDDGNGYIDDWRGWDFVAQNNSPQAGQLNPDGEAAWHGTSVAGLVGAAGNNGIGIATVAWNNALMPLQALDDNGDGYTSDVVAAVYYAVDNGASVINMSLGGSDNDPALADAINYAYAHDVVVVAAAGNCGTGQEAGCDPAQPGVMGYPALDAHVIAVGATDSNNNRASFSSYGPGLDITAPGSGSIVSPAWSPSNGTSLYATSLYGTSFASPLVASYVGLIKSVRPSTNVDDITAIVDGTARKVAGMGSSLYLAPYGHGIANATQGIGIASALNASSAMPTLWQSGNQKAEHHFTSSTTLTSGCSVDGSLPCTIGAQNDAGYDRYLPYQTTGAWSWSGSTLGTGEWTIRARSGDKTSPTYTLLYK